LILDAFGLYVLTPSKVWTQTHNYHHAHTAKVVGSHVGSYMMLTTAMWEQATPGQRFMYKVFRHPLTILFGHFTVFIYGFCTAAFLRNPRKNTDSLLALVVQLAISVALYHYFGFAVLWFSFMLPQIIAHALGGYLFYAQHNFPEAYIQPRESWTFLRASLESSSYMKLGPVMNYLTGNIGYHHVHHLNYRIPFYRLPEAMAGIPELQNPRGVTSLHPRDVIACLRLKLWDVEQGKLVGFPKHPRDQRSSDALAT
jgi:omega-6 fatty acid desaturase (delta-12 desaturase)